MITSSVKVIIDTMADRLLKLLIGVGGIYGAFLYYGTLQEEVFHFKDSNGVKFKLRATSEHARSNNMSSSSLPLRLAIRIIH